MLVSSFYPMKFYPKVNAFNRNIFTVALLTCRYGRMMLHWPITWKAVEYLGKIDFLFLSLCLSHSLYLFLSPSNKTIRSITAANEMKIEL